MTKRTSELGFALAGPSGALAGHTDNHGSAARARLAPATLFNGAQSQHSLGLGSGDAEVRAVAAA